MRWIPINKKTPQEGQSCLLYYPEIGVVFSTFQTPKGTDYKYSFRDGLNINKINTITLTHWMPLPKPPKEK